jgi:hypothetical protein
MSAVRNVQAEASVSSEPAASLNSEQEDDDLSKCPGWDSNSHQVDDDPYRPVPAPLVTWKNERAGLPVRDGSDRPMMQGPLAPR